MGVLIQARLSARGQTLSDIADEALPTASLRRWMLGANMPPLDKASLISQRTGIAIDELAAAAIVDSLEINKG